MDLQITFFSTFIIFTLIGCTPAKDTDDHFNKVLLCGMTYESIVKQAENLNSTSIDLDEDGDLFISFHAETFALSFDKELLLIAVAREMYNYSPFFEGDFHSSMGFKIVLECSSRKIENP